MTRERANKFIGKLVRITFREDWINEATESLISTNEEYIGTLRHSHCEGQEHLYILESDKWLPTNRACWSANSMKRIEEAL